MALKNTNSEKVNLDVQVRLSVQNGTIPPGVSGPEAKYPMNISDVIIDNPNDDYGPTAYPYYPIDYLYEDFRVQLDGDWLAKIKTGDPFEMKRGNVREYYTVQRNIVTGSPPKSLLYLATSRETLVPLDVFIGTTGYPYPSPDTSVLLNRKLENPNVLVNNLLDFTTKMVAESDSTFNLDVKWAIDPIVKITRLRWRSKPRNSSTSTISFSIITPGYYSEVPSATVVSNSGRSAKVQLESSVFMVNPAAGGTGYTTASAFAVGGGGTGASFSVSLLSGQVTAIAVVSGGLGYTANPAILITGDGTGASAFVSVSEVNGIQLIQQGGGYMSPPTVEVDNTLLVGATVDISSSLVLSNEGRVDYIRVLDGGSGYTGASVSVSGSYALDDATAEAVIEKGVITEIKLTYSGYGYTAANVSIIPTGPSGSGAQAKANVDIYSEWVYEEPLTSIKERTIKGFKYNIPYEIQILVSPDAQFRGILNYTNSVPFLYYKG